jgi:biopolymer transport protein ExbD
MVTIQVSDAGTCYWNRELISRDEITPRLEQYKKATQNPRVLIAGDSKAKFGFTVYALDQVRKAGIDQVSVETRVRKTGE